ncbi:MAG: DUF2842 domain-containing protein [Rhodobacterales bacterium]|nr:DUF2842 domain-containing protein [Rhodobacterales bacterium]MDX5412296.1 DUF2842 domain-containing protein [Rhodobacterales bacterium]
MALSYKARRRWSLVILLVGLPIYITLAVNIVEMFERPPFWLELAVFVGLGFLWMMPFKFVFRGIGQADPDAPQDDDKD